MWEVTVYELLGLIHLLLAARSVVRSACGGLSAFLDCSRILMIVFRIAQ